MPASRQTPATLKAQTPWYRGAEVPLPVIRQFVRQVAEQFHPVKIVLFGSHADGTPHADSDVDILVIMPCRNAIDQACRIDAALDPPFPLDLIVIGPSDWERRLALGDALATDITTRGKVLYETVDGGLGAQSRGRLPVRNSRRRTVS